MDQVFVVWTSKPKRSGLNLQPKVVWTEILWSGPDKVVQTGENWYFQNSEKTSPTWFRPLLLVQTTKTWSIPSFSRLHLSMIAYYTDSCTDYYLLLPRC